MGRWDLKLGVFVEYVWKCIIVVWIIKVMNCWFILSGLVKFIFGWGDFFVIWSDGDIIDEFIVIFVLVLDFILLWVGNL